MENDLIVQLISEAENPDTMSERLSEIWNTTKSSRVRKAIAANPNCSTKLLGTAARLYIKEVLGNQSIEILNLFADDKFIKQLYDAYNDPASFAKSNNLLNIRNNNSNRTNIARALLVSPKLRSVSVLSAVCGVLTSLEFSREIKDKDVEKNVKAVAASNPSFFTMGSLLFLLNHGVINLAQVDRAFITNLTKDNKPSYYTSSGAYVKFVKQASDRYETVLMFLRVHSPHNCKELTKSIKKDSYFLSDQSLTMFGDLHRDSLHIDTAKQRVANNANIARYGFSYCSGLSESMLSFHLSEIVWTIIAERNLKDVNVTDIDLEAIYNDIVKVGFDKSYGPFGPKVRFNKIESTLTGRLILCEKLLNLRNDEAVRFFVQSGMLNSEWYARGGSDNVETKLVERLNRINQDRFNNGQPLMFKYSELGEYETIAVVQINGLEHDARMFNFREPYDELPPASGRLNDWLLERLIES